MRKRLASVFCALGLGLIACSVPDITVETTQLCESGNACAESLGSSYRVDCATAAPKFATSVPDRCRSVWSEAVGCLNEQGSALCTSKGFAGSPTTTGAPTVEISQCGSQLRAADACYPYTKFQAAMGATQTGMPPTGPTK